MSEAGTAATPILYLGGETAHADDIAASLDQHSEFDVVRAVTASEAREILSTRSDIECLLTAQSLPDTDGLAFLEAIRSEYPALPVVFYPTRSSEALVIEALSADATEYLQYEDTDEHLDELVGVIREAIDENWMTLALRERLKELEAIQQVTHLLVDEVTRQDSDVLSDVVERIPDSFQYPSITEVRLTVGETVVATDEFDSSTATLAARALTADATTIVLEVGYTESRPPADDGPFLSEEQALCETLVALLQGSLERRAYLESLTEAERIFRELAENINEVAWVSDQSKDAILYVNPAYERVWGKSVESLYADPSSFLDAVHPEDRERVERAVAKQVTGKYDEEYRVVQPDGEVRWVHDRAVPVTNSDEQVYRLVGLAEDITERKEREQQLAVLNRVLRHNLRNELNVILSNAELISRDATTDESASRADTIASVSTRLMAVADKQRTIASQLATSDQVGFVNVSDLLSRLARRVREKYPGATITVEPAELDDAFLSKHIEIAIAEVLTNAVEHADSDSPTVVVSAETDGTTLVIRVADDGPGIPVQEREVLGGTEGDLLHGSGLGLWLVYWSVTGAGGTISFDANEPRGSVVTIRLPQKGMAEMNSV